MSLTTPLTGKFERVSSETESCRVEEAVVTLWMPVTTTFSDWAKAPTTPRATTATAVKAFLKNNMLD